MGRVGLEWRVISVYDDWNGAWIYCDRNGVIGGGGRAMGYRWMKERNMVSVD